ncbi:MAG: hypothetical protein AVDCRST_MAG88-3378 [uncultured Thermomicrobiales bacterium]|uniref:Uncharacterized protein n=1 Tax=uncultured Thermomicrobiales bacterium TaxID=1645740 RepID=A0A6J4VLD2_9BACT|nr:MAG: hypothetical protein AVDCRST_MAG88-3378 [uncultured Thermomicrobiales bacterium]
MHLRRIIAVPFHPRNRRSNVGGGPPLACQHLLRGDAPPIGP